jgi:hypothetical protein
MGPSPGRPAFIADQKYSAWRSSDCAAASGRSELIVGLYLHGSLALGDIDPLHSDIDLLVITLEANAGED